MRGRSILATMAVVLALVSASAPARAQSEEEQQAELAAAIVEAQRQNLQRLMGWSWKLKVHVDVGDAPRFEKVYQVRFVDGQVQRTLVGGQSPRKKPKKKDQAGQQQSEAWAQHVVETIRAYATPSAEELLAFFEDANFVHGSGPMEGTLRIRGTAFLHPDDTVMIWLDEQTRLFTKIEVSTRVSGETINAVIAYDRLKDGTAYVSKATLQSPSKQINARLENLDHIKRGG